MGFSLIEFFCFLILLSILGTTAFHGSLHMYTQLTNATQRLENTTALYSAHDVLTRDLYRAPCDSTLWMKTDADEIVWHNGDHDIGWHLAERTLYRTQGNYDQTRDAWSSYRRSIIATNITEFKIDIHNADDESGIIQAVTGKIVSLLPSQHSQVVERTITIRASVVG